MNTTERTARYAAWVKGFAEPTPSDSEVDTFLADLDDIPVRDALLATITDPAWCVRVGGMLNLIATQRVTAASLTMEAACYYLADSLDVAQVLLSSALDKDPTYSLALLLQSGLDRGAPATLLRASFAHYSPMYLLHG